MGKGDIKTKKGKINAGSYGNSRKRKTAVAAFVPKVKKDAVEPIEDKKAITKKAPVKKTVAKKTTVKKEA